jgi:hypothetical protein
MKILVTFARSPVWKEVEGARMNEASKTAKPTNKRRKSPESKKGRVV